MSDVISVRVAARLRPLTVSEAREGCMASVLAIPETCTVMMGTGSSEKSFGFDYVYPSESTTTDVYEGCVLPLLQKTLQGYNVTIFAYGQTGSGKTFTVMDGYEHIASAASASGFGIAPRLIKDLFVALSSDQSIVDFKVRAACMEIYNEQVFDLLSDAGAKTATNVIIRDNEAGDQVISGLTEVVVASPAAVATALAKGMQARQTASTNMNVRSSRSHAIFTLSIEQTVSTGSDEMEGAALVRRTCKLHIVDLAGSERAKKTGAEGVRLREAAAINKGLLALGNVINALAGIEDDEGKASTGTVHVPFRDSKLTRILKSSLGGNAHTLMIACCSPADSNLEETLSTLRYAARARAIKNKATINMDPISSQLADLRKQVKDLQEALMAARGEGIPAAKPGEFCARCIAESSSASTSILPHPEEQVAMGQALDRISALEHLRRELLADNNRLKGDIEKANEDYQEIADQMSQLDGEKDKMIWHVKETTSVLEKVSGALREMPPSPAQDALLHDLQLIKLRSDAISWALPVQLNDVTVDLGYVSSFLEDIAGMNTVAAPSRDTASAFTSEHSCKAQPPASKIDVVAGPPHVKGVTLVQQHLQSSDLSSLRTQFNEVTRLISQKTKLLEASAMQNDALIGNDAHTNALLGQIHAMENDLKELTEERNKLQKLLESQKFKSSSSGPTPAASSDAAMGILGAKLKEADDKIIKLQGTIRDSSRKLALMAKSQSRSDDLNNEIAQLRKSRAMMQRHMKDTADKARAERQEALRMATKAEHKAEKVELELQRANKQLEEEQAKTKRIHEEVLRLKKQKEERNRAAKLTGSTTTIPVPHAAEYASLGRYNTSEAAYVLNVAQCISGSLSGTRDTTFTGGVQKLAAKFLQADGEDEDLAADDDRIVGNAMMVLSSSMLGAKGHKELNPELRRKLEGLIGGALALKKAHQMLETLKQSRCQVMEEISRSTSAVQAAALEKRRNVLSCHISAVNDSIISLHSQLDAVRGTGGKRTNKLLSAALTDPAAAIKAVSWLSNLAVNLTLKMDAAIDEAASAKFVQEKYESAVRATVLECQHKTAVAEQAASEVLRDQDESLLLMMKDVLRQGSADPVQESALTAISDKLRDIESASIELGESRATVARLSAEILQEQLKRQDMEAQLKTLEAELELAQSAARLPKTKEHMKEREEADLLEADFAEAIHVEMRPVMQEADEDSEVHSEGEDEEAAVDDEDYDDEDEEYGSKKRKRGKNRAEGGRRSRGKKASMGGEEDEDQPNEAPRKAKRRRAEPAEGQQDAEAGAASNKAPKDHCGCTKDCSTSRCACRAAGRNCTAKCKKCKECINNKEGAEPHDHEAPPASASSANEPVAPLPHPTATQTPALTTSAPSPLSGSKRPRPVEPQIAAVPVSRPLLPPSATLVPVTGAAGPLSKPTAKMPSFSSRPATVPTNIRPLGLSAKPVSQAGNIVPAPAPKEGQKSGALNTTLSASVLSAQLQQRKPGAPAQAALAVPRTGFSSNLKPAVATLPAASRPAFQSRPTVSTTSNSKSLLSMR